MHAPTGNIHQLTEAEAKSFSEAMGQLNNHKDTFKSLQKKKLIPLTEKQHAHIKPLAKIGRKKYMRNEPCVCGSGKKMKKCCWHKFK